MASEPCQALVLEDDRAISQLLRAVLAQEHFAAHVVRSATEAIREAGTNRFHLLLLDLMVPDHGTDVIDYLKAHRLDLLQAVVVISAHPYAIRAALKGEYPEPICKFIAKPFDIDELRKVVHSCKALCNHSPHTQSSSPNAPPE